MEKQADEVLDSFKARRGAKACYPCRKRKVRCSGDQPCNTCTARGHPEICFPAHRKRGHNAQNLAAFPFGGSPQRNGTETQMNVPPQEVLIEHDMQEQATPSSTTIGAHSMPTFLDRMGEQSTIVRQDLGLESAFSMSFFTPQGDLNSLLAELKQLAPARSELQRFMVPFCANVVPLCPVIEDSDAFQLSAFVSLDNIASLQAAQMTMASFYQYATSMALFLVALALGAQYADLAADQRSQQATMFGRRCVACLRLSGCPLNPKTETVQTLLLLGMALQNSGQSDGAWSLLGLTYRISQSLGLQPKDGPSGNSLWHAVLWQDCLLSLRFDRTPLSTPSTNDLAGKSPDHFTTYLGAMKQVNTIARAFLCLTEKERCNETTISTLIQAIENLLSNCSVSLISWQSCGSLIQRIKCLALRMHVSFLTAEMCRPFLMSATETTANTPRSSLGDKCVRSMVDNIRAYLDMAKISTMPLRSWSFTHESLACACVLALLDPSPYREEINSLLDETQLLGDAEVADDNQYSTSWTPRTGLKLLQHLRTRRRTRTADSGGDLGANRNSATQFGDQEVSGASQPTQHVDMEDPELLTDQAWFDAAIFGLGMPLASFFDRSSEMLSLPDNFY